jgi:hypothetical protein
MIHKRTIYDILSCSASFPAPADGIGTILFSVVGEWVSVQLDNERQKLTGSFPGLVLFAQDTTRLARLGTSWHFWVVCLDVLDLHIWANLGSFAGWSCLATYCHSTRLQLTQVQSQWGRCQSYPKLYLDSWWQRWQLYPIRISVVYPRAKIRYWYCKSWDIVIYHSIR